MTPPTETPIDRSILVLIQQLGAKDSRTREDASLALHAMGPQVEPILIAYLDKDMSLNLRRAIARWLTGTVIGAVCVAILDSCFPHIPVISGWIARYYVEIPFFCGAVTDIGRGITLQQAAIIQLLTQSSWPGVIEPLLKHGWGLEADRAVEVKDAVARLLPFLGNGDIACMDDERRKKFFSSLHRAMKDRNVDLVVAVIDALGRIGDSDALWNIEQAAKRKDPEIQGAAMIAIDRIRARTFVSQTPEKPGM